MSTKIFTLQILIPLTVGLVFLFAVTVSGLYSLQQKRIEEETGSTLVSVGKTFADKIDRKAVLLNGLIDFIKKDEGLTEAWLARDRNRLLKIVRPTFDSIKSKYRVTHFYFIDLNRASFLRAHNQQRFGDYVDRFTMESAASKGEPAHGIELGPFGTFTLRTVQPWLIDGKPAGDIELGMEIEHITPELSSILDSEIIFLIKNKHLDRISWEEGLKMMNKKGNRDQFFDFVVIDNTMDAVPREIRTHLEEHGAGVEDSFEQFTITGKVKGETYNGGFAPLFDASCEDMGEIAVLKNIIKENTRLSTLIAALFGIGGNDRVLLPASRTY